MKFLINFFKKRIAFLQNLSEIKYFKKSTEKEKTSTELSKFNKNLLIEGIVSMYIIELLKQLKTGIIAEYDDQIKTQKILADNITQRHSQEHKDVIRNVETLLNNLSIINNMISCFELYDSNLLEDHIKQTLGLQNIKKINFKK